MRYEELGWPKRGRLWLRILVRTCLIALSLLLFFKLGLPLLSFCMPFVLALILTWLLEPLVRALVLNTPLSRKALSILVILLICGILGGALAWLGYKVVLEVSVLSENWSAVWGDISGAVAQASQSAERIMAYLPAPLRDALEGASKDLVTWFTNLGTSSLLPKTTSVAVKIPSVVLSLIFFLMGTYFIMADFPRIGKVVTNWMPVNIKAFFRFLGRTFQIAFGGYIRAELLLSLVVFGILLLGFFLMGQSYAFLLALLLGIMDFIPIIGAGTVMVPWALIKLALGDWQTAVILMVIWGIIVVFRRVAEPRFLDSQTGLHPLLALIAIFVGLKSFGVLGMVLAPTLFLVAMNVCASGVFDGLVADVSLAFRDLSAFLGSWRKDLPPEPEEGNPFAAPPPEERAPHEDTPEDPQAPGRGE